MPRQIQLRRREMQPKGQPIACSATPVLPEGDTSVTFSLKKHSPLIIAHKSGVSKRVFSVYHESMLLSYFKIWLRQSAAIGEELLLDPVPGLPGKQHSLARQRHRQGAPPAALLQ